MKWYKQKLTCPYKQIRQKRRNSMFCSNIFAGQSLITKTSYIKVNTSNITFNFLLFPFRLHKNKKQIIPGFLFREDSPLSRSPHKK